MPNHLNLVEYYTHNRQERSLFSSCTVERRELWPRREAAIGRKVRGSPTFDSESKAESVRNVLKEWRNVARHAIVKHADATRRALYVAPLDHMQSLLLSL